MTPLDAAARSYALGRLDCTERLCYVGALTLGVLLSAGTAYTKLSQHTRFFPDAMGYWLSRVDPLTYAHSVVGAWDAVEYSPAFVMLVSPLTTLPWQLFAALWIGLQVCALLWLCRSLPRLWLLPAFALAGPEFLSGNIHLFLALAMALGFRRPGAWAFPLLTKVTPGLGLLWFAFRGEWRRLAMALIATILVVGLSVAVSPSMWAAWIEMLLRNRTVTGVSALSIPLLARAPFAIAILWWGARRARRWTVVVAALLCAPTLYLNSFTMLFGIIPLLVGSSQPISISQGTRQSMLTARP